MAIDITPTTILAPFEAEHQAVNLTRNNKGSRWDRIGNNELIDPDQWRYNYNPDTAIFEGRTIMGQWTQLFEDIVDIRNSKWEFNGTGSISYTDSELNPSIEALIADFTGSGSGTDAIRYDFASDSVPCQPSSPYTFSAFLKLISGVGDIDLYIAQYDSGGAFITSDSVNETIDGTVKQYSITIETESNAAFINPRIRRDSGDKKIYFDLPSLVNRTSPPPTPVYGETAGQSYTQDPDMPDVTNLADINYNPDESTFSIEFNTAYSEGTLFDLHSDANNRIYAHRNASNEIHLVIVNGGTTQADLNLGTIADNTQGKIAVGWKDNDIAGALNGGTVQTDTSATIPTVDTLHIGRDYNDTNYWNAFIGGKLNYPRKLENNDIQDESR